ncbi:MAG: acyl-CoA dehydrogenase [Polyangiaceae bacterium]|nr:acyl-CoA dehydrogenase [Polyangiaceae bacterium]
MLLFHPHKITREYADEFSRDIVRKTIAFFEAKGLARIKQDDQAMTWYDDYLAFIKEEGPFAALLTPSRYGSAQARWDMWRLSEYNEVLGFYGLCYWYAWQVTILGLGPIWMGDNEQAKHRTAKLLQEGGVFAFGLSERDHGADIYSTEMTLHPKGDGTYLARGRKYYIGNGNCAALVSIFGKFEGTGEYVFFVVRTDHASYECVRKIDTSGVRQAYVAELELHDYPITEADILSRGKLAFESSLNTVNIGKFELGFASIGIATHCFYEAINHATGRKLYGQSVTDFPHVKREFTEAWLRLMAMKLFALRASDYMRSASDEDRRYLLYNPIVKMKVTSQGEKVVALLHDIIAAKGFEQDTYFEMAIRDVGMLPKLEGTEHVNMALIIKFIKNYFFGPIEHPIVPRRIDATDDSYLFRQFTGKLSQVRFPSYRQPYEGVTLPNVHVFREQMETFRQLLVQAPPTEQQSRNVDYLLAAGELFTLCAYAQLILENSKLYAIDNDVLDSIFGMLVKDFAGYALKMVVEYDNTDDQEQLFRAMIRKPVRDPKRATTPRESRLPRGDGRIY